MATPKKRPFPPVQEFIFIYLSILSDGRIFLTHDEKQLTMFDIEEAPGRPMLHWLGKRPLRAVKYYEAQLKEAIW